MGSTCKKSLWMKEKKQYSKAFKGETIRFHASSGNTVDEVERDFGLSHGLLRHWKKRFRVSEAGDLLERSEGSN